MTALTGIYEPDKETCESDKESYVRELIVRELDAWFTEMCLKNEIMCREVLEQKILISQLEGKKEEHLSIITNLREEVIFQK